MTRAEPLADDRPSLYERDFCLWLERQAALFRERRVVEHRQRLRDDFEESPSLRPHAAEAFARAYADARERASAETGLPLRGFPKASPYTLEQTLDPKFLPEWR